MRLDVLNEMEILVRGGEIGIVSKSAMAKIMGCDPRTVKKYLDGYVPKKRRTVKKKSKLDEYKNIIETKMEIGCSSMAIFKYIQKEGYKGSYSLVADYALKHKKEELTKATMRYETSRGLQAQVDWKESIKMTSRSGQIYEVNIFLMVLGYSRLKFLKLTSDRTQKTLFNCMNAGFKYFKGVPREILFDNMPTVVDRANSRIGNVKINGNFMQYSKDVGFKIITCRAYRPQTKGKVESLAKLVDRLKVYNNEFEGYEELEQIVNNFMEEINNEVSQGTNEKPVDRVKKETKYLLPLPNQDILKTYIASPKEYKVSKESMITYKKHKYSVPIKYIGEYLTVSENEDTLNIYSTTDLIASHKISRKIFKLQKRTCS